MNKHLPALFFLTALVITTATAQSIVTADSPQYHSLKQEGQLQAASPVDVRPYTVPGSTATQPHKSQAGNPAETCNCLIEPDETFTLAMNPNDDGSSGLITLPFNFCFYGSTQTNMYINNNGNISFGDQYTSFSSNPFPDASFVMIAPFWSDVDTRGSGQIWFKVTSSYIIVRWQDVGYYSQQTDKLNDFQLILSDGTDPIIPAGNNVAFCYGDMQWTTGAGSGGVNGFGGVPATAGANFGDGVSYIQLGRFDHAGTDYDGPFATADGVSWLDNRNLTFNACVNNTNISPIADANLLTCDTITLCVGDSFIFDVNFYSPETGQVTTTVIDSSAISGLELLDNSSGNTSSVAAVFHATQANTGFNTFTLTATDDGTPAQTTVAVVNFVVLPLPEPAIIDNGTYLTTQSYDSYQWYFNGNLIQGATQQDLTLTDEGMYSVKVSLNGCESDFSSVYVYTVGVSDHGAAPLNIFPNPAADILYIENTTGKGLYTLRDITGKTLLAGNITAQRQLVDISALNKGIYFISVVGGGHPVNWKVVKQ